MLSPDTALQFFIAAIILGLAPGPDIIFVLTQSAVHGARAGLATTLGLISGLFFHTALVALGVAVIFQTSALAFTLLKAAGAAYLLYLAWLSFRAGSVRAPGQAAAFTGCMALYRRGVIMNITNPKVSLFFLAFLPQFASPAHGSVTAQILQLGLLFMLATLLVFGSTALLAGRLASRFNQSPRAQIFLNRLAACVFCALAVMLLFTGHA